jgi:hypothetical protein
MLWESNPTCLFYRPGSGDVPIACLLTSNGITVARCLGGVARSEAMVPNLHAWLMPNLHAWTSYQYMCMCGCTADTCLYVCMVNGKCGCCSVVRT